MTWVVDRRHERCVQCGKAFETVGKRYREYDLCPKCKRILARLGVSEREWLASFKTKLRPLYVDKPLHYHLDDWGYFSLVIAVLAQAARDGQVEWLRSKGVAWLDVFKVCGTAWVERFIECKGDIDMRFLLRPEGCEVDDGQVETA